ncbi:energy-coupled thiamine transporter ThiT [Streptococcus acidominimus]|uniref:Energy-coupled thiamine transporter ThiT n=1 Tax=Streptococcus acidominimus TaxID=1326 RepID=A0A1Q8EFJ5_STRAI|nr:energy-coupled thiamine transporter ThiT [Streptococcus acidominimus]MBF0848776.1 energy-coupled thiamine transporter ThiT [Streptococcus danieliae]MBF0818536.1 energy-coupled thiamine transporter ThiT [Streptococcus acidominimus]MBF0839115.1 energy-coupled thiamine transporter ThiT [Streptococcus acidominimus]OLF50549.1 energy-coupled thiamine transporter ThiT [Streptococcus acidominimus]TFU31174.1 energy-coupled thiamine transporter ThiT [Streptococcus acidominimus]
MSKNLTALVEVALFAALAMVLSFIPDFMGWFNPSFGAIPLVLISLRRGSKYGLLAGLIWGLLHFVLGKVYYLSFAQVVIEYILAFLAMGLAGYLAPSFQRALKEKGERTQALGLAFLAAILAVFVRYLIHYIAGVIFWSSYAPEGMSAYWYSFTVNGTAGGLTLLVVLIVLGILVPTSPRFFLPNK